jgi:hypothetical protein
MPSPPKIIVKIPPYPLTCNAICITIRLSNEVEGETKMVKATKATKQRLKKIQSTLAEILLERIEISENLASCIEDGFKLTEDDCGKGFYSNDCLYIKAKPWEKPYFNGFQTRYPSLISTTFTHGLNEVQIPDINKMVKAMLLD